jgi:hypothetical protein
VGTGFVGSIGYGPPVSSSGVHLARLRGTALSFCSISGHLCLPWPLHLLACSCVPFPALFLLGTGARCVSSALTTTSSVFISGYAGGMFCTYTVDVGPGNIASVYFGSTILRSIDSGM